MHFLLLLLLLLCRRRRLRMMVMVMKSMFCLDITSPRPLSLSRSLSFLRSASSNQVPLFVSHYRLCYGRKTYVRPAKGTFLSRFRSIVLEKARKRASERRKKYTAACNICFVVLFLSLSPFAFIFCTKNRKRRYPCLSTRCCCLFGLQLLQARID